MANQDPKTTPVDVSGDAPDIDSMVDEFRSVKPGEKIVEPIESGTADALTAVPTAKKTRSTMFKAPQKTTEESAEPEVQKPVFRKRKKNIFMRFLGGFVPHVGDNAFDIVRKIIMIAGVIVFVAAATYLVDDLVLIPRDYEIQSEQREEMYYNPVLTPEEEAFVYPEGINDSFKKLYYHNSDTRGWLSFHSTDDEIIDIEYPVLQSADNDFYLMRDFNKNYNKNGSLFYDYRNMFISENSLNKNTIIYGHNMLSGQMLAGLNTLLNSISYARNATTLTMNTLYEEAEYKVFALMVLNTEEKDGYPFGYLRTDFNDNIDFAGFLAEIKARSVYDYTGVELRPDDEIVMLSTCTSSGQVHFTEGRTVLVARKIREGEDPAVDPTTIIRNDDVIMPYGWYVNQRLEPHPYYLDADYYIEPIDTLEDFIATSTSPLDTDVTTSPIGTSLTDPTGTTLPTVSAPSHMTTRPTGVVTGTASKYLKSIYVEYTPKVYRVGEQFKASQTVVNGVYTNGTVEQLDIYSCGLSGFDTSTIGQRAVGIHYGDLSYRFVIQVIEAAETTATTRTTTTRRTAPPRPTATRPTTTRATTAPTTTVTTTAPTTTTVTTTTTTSAAPTLPPTVPRPTVPEPTAPPTEPSDAEPATGASAVSDTPVSP